MSRLLSPQNAEYHVVIVLLITKQMLLKPATVEKKFMHIHLEPRVAAKSSHDGPPVNPQTPTSRLHPCRPHWGGQG